MTGAVSFAFNLPFWLKKLSMLRACSTAGLRLFNSFTFSMSFSQETKTEDKRQRTEDKGRRTDAGRRKLKSDKPKGDQRKFLLFPFCCFRVQARLVLSHVCLMHWCKIRFQTVPISLAVSTKTPFMLPFPVISEEKSSFCGKEIGGDMKQHK